MSFPINPPFMNMCDSDDVHIKFKCIIPKDIEILFVADCQSKFCKLVKIYPSLKKTATNTQKAYAVWLSNVFNNDNTDKITHNFVNEYSNFDKGKKIKGYENWYGKTGNQILFECVKEVFSGDHPLTEGVLWRSFEQIYGESQYYKKSIIFL